MAERCGSGAARFGTVGCTRWFGRRLPYGILNFSPSSLKLVQSLFQVGHFFLDLVQLCLILSARLTICAKLFSDVLLELIP